MADQPPDRRDARLHQGLPRRRSLLRRMMVVMALSLIITMLGGGLGLCYITFRTEFTARQVQQTEEARSMASAAAKMMERAQSELALVTPPDWHKSDETPLALQNLLRQDNNILEVACLDPTGAPVALAFGERQLFNDAWMNSRTRWFLAATSGQTSIGDAQRPAGHVPYFVLAQPAGEKHVVVARLRLEALQEMVTQIHFGLTGQAYITDGLGRVLAHSDPSLAIGNALVKGRPGMNEMLQSTAAEWTGSYTNLQGVTVLATSDRVDGTDWRVVTELPPADAFRASRTSLLLVVLSLVIAGSIIADIFYHLIKRVVVRPLDALATGARRVGEGDLSHRIEIASDDEFSRVAAEFNHMAEHLVERDGQLARQATNLADEVAERRKAEAALRAAHDELEVRVQQRTEELAQANRGLAKANAELQAEIAERRRVAEALRASELQYRDLFDNATDLIQSVDTQGRFLLVNRAWIRTLGYNVEDLATLTIWDIIEPGCQEHCRTNFGRVFAGQSVRNLEVKFVAKDGRVLDLEGNANGRFEDGQVVATRAIFHDVTDRRAAQVALQEYAARLERSNAELQEFTYIASHDLQEPLRKVRAFGDRLHERYAEALGEQGLDYLTRMQNSASRMQALIDGLLAYTRVATKAQPFSPVDLNQVAVEVLDDLETRIEDTHARVEVAGLPVIDADPLQMRQLMQNLIGNALKFTRSDTPPVVRVTAEHINGHGTRGPGDPPDGELCRLTVSDNGIGFDEKYVDRIFQVFQRLHGQNQYQGSGIGLAVCRKIAERHGGFITAHSAPGEGATFIITLPSRHASSGAEDSKPGHD